jgi:photosystem II stability/assembly factor-like uncharacterized protein
LQTQQAPYQNGVSYLDGNHQPRDITFTVALRELSNLVLPNVRAEIQSKLKPTGQGYTSASPLTGAVRSLRYGKLSYSATGATFNRFIDGVVTSVVFSNKAYKDGFQRALIRVFCPDPYWYGAEVVETLEPIFDAPAGVINSITWLNGTYCAVGGQSTYFCLTSENGAIWTSRTMPTGVYKAVTTDYERFIAVGDSSKCATSDDGGKTWTARTIPTGSYKGLFYDETIYRLVAVGNGVCATSDNGGITWTARTIPALSFSSVIYSYTASLLIAVGFNACATSSDGGETWTSQTIPAGEYNAVTGGSGLIVAVGYDCIATSTNGTSWTAQSYPVTEPALTGVVWNGPGTDFTAVGTNVCLTTSNGTTWTEQTIPAGAYNDLAIISGLAYAVGESCIATSPNSTTWTAQKVGLIPPGNYQAIAHNGSIYAIVGPDSTCSTSPDGLFWTSQTFPALSMSDLIWTGSLFVGVGFTSCVTSTDGETWTSKPIPGNVYVSVASNGSRIVAVHGAGATYSDDNGATWTDRPLAVAPTKIVWFRDQFVINADTCFYTSPDGEYWTTRTKTGDGQGLAFNADYIITSGHYSRDAITWTVRALPSSAFNYDSNGLAWTGSLFVAVGSACATSPDGITFTARTIPSTVNAIAWNGLMLCAVGNNVCLSSPTGEAWTTFNPSDYAKTITVTGDVNTPILASLPIAGNETGKIVTLSSGVVWSGAGTPPSSLTMALSTDGLSKYPLIVDTTFGDKTVTHFDRDMISKFIGGKLFSLAPGPHNLNMRNSGNPGTAPTITYKPRYLGV